jgi:tRNA A-37 threonylcarbamoyl transferase component Bud32
LRGEEWGRWLGERLDCEPDAAPAWVEAHTRLLKSDAYSRVGLLRLRDRDCYLKLYLAKSRLQQLGFRLGIGRGLRSFTAAQVLARAGLPVPRPLACLLLPEGMVLLTEAIEGASDLRALWLGVPAADEANQYMHAAGTTVADLHRAGLVHGDCKWSNLLWAHGELYLVDLEAVRRTANALRRGILPARQLRDLARFIIDAEELGASAGQLEVFLASYIAGARCSREELVAALRPLLASIRYRHQRRYRTEPRPLL